MNAVAEKYRTEINNSTPLLKQVRYMENDIPCLRHKWLKTCKDIIEESVLYRLYKPKCPDSLRTLLTEKIVRYTHAGWWRPMSVSQASPMLCLPKKDGGLRTTKQMNCNKQEKLAFQSE